MYEYVTVSASSYDPGSLAAKLTEKSAEGWEVVSIVPTGGDVTAFCRREVAAAEPAAAPVAEASIEELAAAAAVETAEPAPAFAAAAVEPEPVVQPASTSPWAATTTEAAPVAEPAPAQPAEPAAYVPTAAAAPAAPAQPAQPQVPAGWYSDPSGRFELRYWDGNGWTEHVARGGQQSTDPPVA